MLTDQGLVYYLSPQKHNLFFKALGLMLVLKGLTKPGPLHTNCENSNTISFTIELIIKLNSLKTNN